MFLTILFLEIEESVDLAAQLQSSVCIGKTGFAKMQGDVDKHRSAKQQSADILASEVTRKTKFVDFLLLILKIFFDFFFLN